MKNIRDYFHPKPNPVAAVIDSQRVINSSAEVATGGNVGLPPLEPRVSTEVLPSENSGGRTFQSHWIKQHGWVSYDEDKGRVHCSICVQAISMQMPLPNTSRDKDAYEAFVVNGFSNWKKALERFASHEKSSFHRASVQMIATATSSSRPSVAQQLNSQQKKEMADARVALTAIFSSLLYLVCLNFVLYSTAVTLLS